MSTVKIYYFEFMFLLIEFLGTKQLPVIIVSQAIAADLRALGKQSMSCQYDKLRDHLKGFSQQVVYIVIF